MIPAAVVVLFYITVTVAYALRVEAELARLRRVNAKQDKAHEKLKSFFEDVIVGHANEVRLRKALERIWEGE